MSTIVIKYTTPSTYKEMKGVELRYHFKQGALGFLDHLPDDAIIFVPLLYDNKPYVGKATRYVMENYVTAMDVSGYTFEEKDIFAQKEVNVSEIKTSEDFNKVMQDKDTVLVFGEEPKEDIMEKTTINSTETVVATPINQPKEESTMSNITLTQEQLNATIAAAVAQALAQVTSTSVKTEPVVEVKEQTDINTAITDEMIKELGLSREEISESLGKIEGSEIKETLEFIKKYGTKEQVERVNRYVLTEDDKALQRTIELILSDIAYTNKDQSIRNKGKVFLNQSLVKVTGFLGWAKENGLKVLNFVWSGIKWVWSHIYDLGAATVGFVGDIFSILFRHVGEIFTEVGAAAGNRYSPVFESWGQR